MALPKDFDFTAEESKAFRKTLVILVSVWAFLLTSGICFTLWYTLSGPKVTNVTNNEYKNLSQWQATVVFPNGGVPIEIEHFYHHQALPSGWMGRSERAREYALQRIAELSARCLWWQSEPVDFCTTATCSIITCFKEKKKEK